MMNNYSFIRVVGKGSYGEVNLVKHNTDRKQYVIKKLNLTTSSKRERRAAEQEAQLLSRLRHPNIVTYRESWEGDDRQLYIVMGFCEGGDLYHRLKQQKGELLPERQVVEWFVQIAMALQYLHERNILHRDLKTQNIFLTKTNIIKVGDLGIARVLENQNDMASTLIGTPYYMSPELFSNKPYNHKSDVWALGCCVYEMSTLKHAFNAKDMNSLVYRIVEGKLPPMPSQYHPHLGELIKSMLCKKPEDRPDVKHILRQPYIKRQIAMFLEATKEKTAKSRKKAAVGPGDCSPSGGSSGASRHPKPQKLPPSPNTVAQAKQREDKSREHKTQNGVADFPPALPSQALAPSVDILKAGISPLATVSSINIDIPLQLSDGLMKNPVQRPPSVESRREPGTHIVCKDRKARWKPDPSPPPPPPVNPALRAESGVCARGGDERTASDGLSDVQPNPGGARPPASVENQDSHVDIGDDTGELLREAELNSNAENVKVDVSADSNNDTVTLIKGTPAHLHMPNVDDSLETTEKLLERPAVEPVEEESSSLWIKRDPATVCQNPQILCEPSGSEQHRGMLFDPTKGGHKQLAASRPLPRPPTEAAAVERKRRIKKTVESKRVDATAASTSVSSSKDGLLPLPQERPLTARERRRLRQSQDGAGQPGPSVVRRASYDVASTKAERHNAPVTRSASYTVTDSGSKVMEQRSDEDEYSSSTSSTERSEGDCRERKTESNDMHDLVHMMTQTLRMDVGDAGRELGKGRLDSSVMPEFKLNRRYRDTLVLHGKAREEAGSLSLGEIPTGATSGPAKVRRAIERLRTDVVKGLGVKLLDKVLEVMEEEDEVKRELCLRDQMGDEKYQAYAVMVRQLKFFEDIAVKI
ncbi:serine/threonine-protein kinase Nek4 isoform X2 [Poecilia latipinna]|uniref:serine/threonine-protein kinase Nek4 isoform X2 n=1 Tax=Poecilia latipinna TaxID=48699 RepID=UPI00072DB31F|nr:PREDICTED: serine/threonine-protein kinase Nek4 isoform X2 [Poecilia latipinna]